MQPFLDYDMLDQAAALPFIADRYGSVRAYAWAPAGLDTAPRRVRSAPTAPGRIDHADPADESAHALAGADGGWADQPLWTSLSPVAKAAHLVLVVAMVAMIAGATVAALLHSAA
jgi:hypothetical protein